MAKKPILEIEYDTNGVALSGKCSACGAEMDKGENRTLYKDDSAKWFEDQFSAHVKRRHSREDFSQAAARVVREATEK